MNMVSVPSRAIAAIGYENGFLVIAFRAGGVYQYSGVPLQAAQGLLYAPSKGRYYRRFIQGKYPAIKIG